MPIPYVFNVKNNGRLRQHNAKSLVEKSIDYFIMLAVGQKSMLQSRWEKNCEKVDAE
jgi:hypothetical protein